MILDTVLESLTEWSKSNNKDFKNEATIYKEFLSSLTQGVKQQL